ncbi:MAG: GYD domain-containing protein [Methanomicrobiales archaeon]|nr:GYD domain-containing protein [Methanomicrobiales archaeon]
MTVYITLGNLSRKAFEKIDSLEERDRKARKVIESLGGTLISLHYTLGRYDFVAMMDMPSQESLVKFLAILGKHGTVRTETLETIPSEMLYRIAKEV